MEFFQALSAITGGIDISMRIKEKKGRVTVSVLPESSDFSGQIKPILVTGSIKELDEGFITAITPAINEFKGLVTTVDEFKNQVAQEKEKQTKPAAEKKSATAAAKEKRKEPPKKNTAAHKKKVAEDGPKEHSIFDGDANEDNDEVKKIFDETMNDESYPDQGNNPIK